MHKTARNYLANHTGMLQSSKRQNYPSLVLYKAVSFLNLLVKVKLSHLNFPASSKSPENTLDFLNLAR